MHGADCDGKCKANAHSESHMDRKAFLGSGGIPIGGAHIPIIGQRNVLLPFELLVVVLVPHS